MKPFNETEFRALMLQARIKLWDVSEEKDDREPVSTAMAMALADMEEAACRSLKVIQGQHYQLNPQPKESYGSSNSIDGHVIVAT